MWCAGNEFVYHSESWRGMPSVNRVCICYVPESALNVLFGSSCSFSWCSASAFVKYSEASGAQNDGTLYM